MENNFQPRNFRPVPFVNLGAQYRNLREEILAKVDELSSAGAYILGDEVTAFENEFAAYCGAKHAVSCANATDGIMLALKAMGIGVRDEVITAPNSFIGTAGGIIAAGATPTFCDVGSDYNLDPSKLEASITKKTRAIMPVHLTGMPTQMDEVNAIAKKHGLLVLEDAAQAVGAKYKGKRVGNLGDVAIFSLHPLKNLHLHGDGGIITTNSESIDKTLRMLRNHGLVNRDESHIWGYNSRLDAIQAAIGRIKLKLIDGYNQRYREIASMYREGLGDYMFVPSDSPGCEGVYHNFVVRVENRKGLQDYMLKHGQETKIHYPIPIHMQKSAAALGHKVGAFPETEKQAEQILTMPIYPELTNEQVKSVIMLARSFFEK